MTKPKKSQPNKLLVLLKWVGLLAVCAAVAVPLAKWWDIRSDRQFQERLQKASVSELQEMTKTRDWDPALYYTLGMKLLEAGQNREAAKALDRSVQLNPKVAAVHSALGLALARSNEPLLAEEALKRAIKQDPNFFDAHFTLGNLYGKYERWSLGADALKKAVELQPNHVEAQYLLAMCYGEIYQEDKKMEVLEKLTRQVPDNPQYLKSLGYVYLFFGKFEQAENIYLRLLEKDPNDLETRYLRGRALAERANTPEGFATAEKELNAVVAKAPRNPGVHLALGILHFRNNKPEAAVQDFERALALGITEMKTYMYLGQSYARVGRKAEADKTLAAFQKMTGTAREITHLENRLLNAPNDHEARLRLVRTYMEDRDYRRAISHLITLQEMKVNNPQIAALMSEASAKLNAGAAKKEVAKPSSITTR